jgi:hypothetical protein
LLVHEGRTIWIVDAYRDGEPKKHAERVTPYGRFIR